MSNFQIHAVDELKIKFLRIAEMLKDVPLSDTLIDLMKETATKSIEEFYKKQK